MLRARLHEEEIRRIIGVPEIGNRIVDGLAPLNAGEDRCLYFINKRATDQVCESLATRQGCIVIVPRESGFIGKLGDCVVLESADPRAAIALVLGFVRDQNRHDPWITASKVAADVVISPLAVIANNVEIGRHAVIEPFCVVDADVSIGSRSILRSGARIHSRVSIGEQSVIGENALIGHQGFGFVRDELGNKVRIPHLGGVIIGSHVEIGSLTTVPSGTIVPTTIEDYAKIDDHVHVGHNVLIARNASITSSVVIAGEAVIEADAWVGINSSIRDGRRVGAHSLVGMDVSLQQDLPDNSVARAPRPNIRSRDTDDSAAIGFTSR
jgi:UDP-3-O-[3-hydroxymyristoyl] glucosamine N-acyltransferase LpxD